MKHKCQNCGKETTVLIAKRRKWCHVCSDLMARTNAITRQHLKCDHHCDKCKHDDCIQPAKYLTGIDLGDCVSKNRKNETQSHEYLINYIKGAY